MKRTGPGVLLVTAMIGVAAGYLLDHALTAGGRPTFTPAVTLPIVLVLLGVAVVAFALPIRRATRGRAGVPPVNPFRAVRVAVLAKSSSIVGAAASGFSVGLALYLLTRPVTPSVGSLSAIIAAAICGAVLVVAGLVAEHLCTIRKDDDDEHPAGSSPEPGRDGH